MHRQCSAHLNRIIHENKAFTLIELMVALVISAVIVAAIYSAYAVQQKTYLAQDQVAEMQQNIRAAMDLLSRDVRMAGYTGGTTTSDTTCSYLASGAATIPGILAVAAAQLDFSMDLDSNGDCGGTGENLSYSIYTAGDGLQKLGRRDNNGGVNQAVAENFDGIEFNYLDSAGSVTTSLNNIRSVQISLLARAGKPDRDFINTRTYTAASGAVLWSPTVGVDDHYRRRLLITTVKCRNMGL